MSSGLLGAWTVCGGWGRPQVHVAVCLVDLRARSQTSFLDSVVCLGEESCVQCPSLSVLGDEHMFRTLRQGRCPTWKGQEVHRGGPGTPLWTHHPAYVVLLASRAGGLRDSAGPSCSTPSPRRGVAVPPTSACVLGSGWGLAPPATPLFSDSGSRGWSAGWARCSCRTALPDLHPPRLAAPCVAGAATCRSSSTVCMLACASRSSSASSEVGWRAVLGGAAPGV